MVLSIVTFIYAAFLNQGDIVAYGIICVLSGAALGADLSLPPALIAARISANKHESEATQYYAVLAFLSKIALAIAAGISFLALDTAGFEANFDNTERALTVLIIFYALIPCILKTVSAALMWQLIKKEGHHNENIERINDHGTTGIS